MQQESEITLLAETISLTIKMYCYGFLRGIREKKNYPRLF